MNSNAKKIGAVAVLAVVLVVVLYFQVLRESPEDKAFRENLEKSKTQAAPGASPATPGAAPPAQAPAAGTGAAPSLNVVKEDIDQLLAQVRKVIEEDDFSYEDAQKEQRRNPMTPLVGPFKVTQDNGGEPSPTPVPPADALLAASIERAVSLSGIVWDEANPMAILDNEVVGVGHRLPVSQFPESRFPNGVYVQSIEQRRIVLRYNEMSIPIELKEQ